MTERWERMVRTLRAVEAPTERIRERVELGPRSPRSPDMRHRLAATVTALALFVGSSVLVWQAWRSSGVSPVSPTSPNSRIVFELWRPSQADTRHLLYVVDANGGSPMNLTPDSAEYSSPAWSPDGRWLAVVRLDPGLEVGIYLMRADGTGLRELLPIGPDAATTVQQIAWSPDGTHIGLVYVDRAGRRADEWVQRLYVMNSDGTSLRPLTDESLRVTSFSWSADGSRMVFAASARGSGRGPSRLFIVDSTGGSPTPVPGVTGSDPAWSPDGRKIAFAGHAGGSEESDIFVMNADGTQIIRVTRDPRAEFWPVWSPDGMEILFQREQPEAGRGLLCSLLLVDASGNHGRVLVEGADLEGCPSRPSWQVVRRG